MIRRSITKDGDYTANVDGLWVESASRMPDVLIALRTRRGSCPVAPNLGNRFGLVPDKITPTTPRVIEHDYREALAHLTESGVIWDLTVASTPLDGGGVETVVSFRDASGLQTETFRS